MNRTARSSCLLIEFCLGLLAVLCWNGVTFNVGAVAFYTEKRKLRLDKLIHDELTKYLTSTASWLSTCRIYEPGFTKCSTSSIQKLIDQLNIGIPDIEDTVGKFDPLKVRDIFFKQDNNEVATIRANLTDVVIKGFKEMKIKESRCVVNLFIKTLRIYMILLYKIMNRVSKKDFSWQTKILIPKMRLNAKYKMAGRILLIPLSGTGNMFIEIGKLAHI